ncbi:hypothetical protein IJH24_01230 [Candidatus Saccharibacteria bacterium]|nr:hypothetical protein [Candidatus Saccharibacteria bacterium]
MLGSIIVAIIAIILMGVAEQTFSEKTLIETDKETGKRKIVFQNLEEGGWLRAVTFGVILGIIHFVTPKLAGFWLFLAPVMLVIMIIMYWYLCARWREKGKTFVGLLMFILLAVLMYWTAMATATMTVACFHLKAGWANLFMTIPILMLVAAAFFFIIDRIFFYSYEKRTEATDEQGEVIDSEADARARISRILGLIVCVIATLVLIALLVGGIKGANFNLPSPFDKLTENQTEATTEAADKTDDKSETKKQEEEDVKEALDNLTVQKLTAEELEKLTTEKYKDISQELLQSSLSPNDKGRTTKTGFSDALTFGFESSKEEEMFLELEEEILRNPVYGVTVANAIKDKKLGNNTIGELNPWMDEMVTLNKENGVSHWVEYRDKSGTIYVTDEYRIYAATLCTWLERLVDQGVQMRQTAENWCLNAAAKNNDRAGIKASYQYKKEALVLSYVGKNGNAIFTIGFNIHDKRPEFFDNNKPKDEETKEDKPKDDKPDNPDDPPDDKPKYKKDPNDAPKDNTEPNDDKGPGENTNSGKGSDKSTKDQDTNSDHYQSYDEYKDDMDDMEETNDKQKQGGDSNEPSTPPTNDTNVDNNGDSGTGNGSIDQPTTDPATDNPADGSNISGEADGAWEGPPD